MASLALFIAVSEWHAQSIFISIETESVKTGSELCRDAKITKEHQQDVERAKRDFFDFLISCVIFFFKNIAYAHFERIKIVF